MGKNRQANKTKSAIKNAFETLICNYEPKKINVKKLTELAGIHRKTFYLHYSCIEELYEETIRELVEEYISLVKNLTIPYNYYDLTKVFFEFCSKTEFYEKIFCNPNYSTFANKVFTATLKHNRSVNNAFSAYTPEEQDIINTFLTGSSLDTFKKWIASEKKLPMERVIELTGLLLEKGVQGLSKK